MKEQAQEQIKLTQPVVTVEELWDVMVTVCEVNQEGADWLKERGYYWLRNQLTLNNIPVTVYEGMKGWGKALVHFPSIVLMINFVNIGKTLNE